MSETTDTDCVIVGAGSAGYVMPVVTIMIAEEAANMIRSPATAHAA